MTDDFDGSDMFDDSEEKFGKVERTYVDDSGAARLLAVKIGTFMARHRLVPAGDAREIDGGLQVPYGKQVVEDSPEVDTGDTLEGDALDTTWAYYQRIQAERDSGDEPNAENDGADRNLDPDAVSAIGETDLRNRPPSDVPSSGEDAETPAEFGQVRDLGDVIEVPIVEEVLVKKPVVREVLRIRKTQISESGTAAADLRQEHVDVLPSSNELIEGDGPKGETG